MAVTARTGIRHSVEISVAALNQRGETAFIVSEGVKYRELTGRRDFEDDAQIVCTPRARSPVEIAVRSQNQAGGTAAVSEVKLVNNAEPNRGTDLVDGPTSVSIVAVGCSSLDGRSIKTSIGSLDRRRSGIPPVGAAGKAVEGCKSSFRRYFEDGTHVPSSAEKGRAIKIAIGSEG